MHQTHDHAAMLAAQNAAAPDGSNTGFWASLFESFTPRQQCMNFEPDVIWLHLVSDTLIAAAYLSIPLALIHFVRRRKDLAFNWMFVLFAAFIIACGTTHIFGIIAIWRPYYRLDGIVKLITGIISVATAILLWPLVAKALLLPSPSQLRVINEQLADEVLVRKRAESAARAASEDLERRVADRTAQLTAAGEERAELLRSERAAREQAELASRIKDDFVATLSHELRTPISAILGWTHLLRANPNRPDAARGLEVVERNTRAQARMIDDLLDISRVVSGTLRLDVQQVDLVEIINAVIATVTPAAQAKDLHLERSFDPTAGPLRADPARLQQIFWNILSNAIKFTPNGGRVHISLRQRGSHVEFIVQDNGQGITPEFLPHVFDRFRQQDASTTRLHGGLGIGLAIVRHLVELHGGSVTARSDGTGTGATFTVTFPLAASKLAEGSPADPASPAPHDGVPPQPSSTLPLAGLRILVVDDELDTRNILRVILSEAGAQVQTAASAADALSLLLQAAPPPHVLISDIGMPGEDGYTLIRRIRQLPDSRWSAVRLPAIALTAFARAEDRTLALSAGFQAHVAKPTEPEELVAAVARIVGRNVTS